MRANDKKGQTTCVDALKDLVEGRLADWTGLPEGCGPDDLSKVLEGGEDEGRGQLSSNPAQFRLYQSSHTTGLIQAWFDKHKHTFLITIVAPHIEGAVKDLLDKLGEPEKKLDSDVGYHADAHQWIYAKRGLTLYVREHSTEIARVAVYLPTSVEYYIQWLGAKDENKYHPRGR